MFFRMLSLSLLGIASLYASSITTSVSCGAGNISQTDANQCSVSQAGNEFTATANASSYALFSLPSSVGDPVTISVNQTINVQPGANLIPNVSYSQIESGGTADATIEINLATGGFVRQGYVVVAGLSYGGWTPGEGRADVTFDIGSLSGTCDAMGGSYCYVQGGLPISTPTPQNPYLVFAAPFTLGQTFALNFVQDSFAHADMGANGPASINPTTNISVQFFESDLATPVSVFDATPAPEPGTWGLLLLSLSVILGMKFLTTQTRVAMHSSDDSRQASPLA
jgi:hypothetical protein